MRGILSRTSQPQALMFMILILAALPLSAQSYSVLYHFKGGADGATPYAGVIHDTAGNLYGTTFLGGPANVGTIFKITGRNENVLYGFAGTKDQGYPMGSLVLDPSGNLYGTTNAGEPLRREGSRPSIYGTLFKVDANGSYRLLHTFTGQGDGAYPFGTMVLDRAGNLYGTTVGGGDLDCVALYIGCGVVFKANSAGRFKVLAQGDGGWCCPFGGLAIDSASNLYGTAVGGDGSLFKLAPDGSLTVLHYFVGSDGNQPYSSLIWDVEGNLVGTTIWGGDHSCDSGWGCGTVFRLKSDGTETVLYSFTGSEDGMYPYASLALDTEGNLYGVASQGGTYGYGTVFKLDASGHLTVLHNFTGGTDGGNPYGTLLLSGKSLYGTASIGGTFGCGVVFRVGL
jgi:uncharacterized repeat protein (TIGR03803 family)